MGDDNIGSAVEIWFVRHGQTDWNIEHRLQGHTDISLNATGILQANAAATHLAQVHAATPFDHIVSSDLARALTTAEAIDAVLHVQITQDPGLREHNLGRLQGFTSAEMPGDLHRDYAALRSDPDFDGHGGESSRAMSTRVHTTLASLVTRFAGQRIVAVTHGGFLYHTFRHIHALSIDRSTDDKTPNACICVLQHHHGRWHILEWGLTDHL
ncbi:Aste57867_10271 [Aphanomyces stellatus]|uniref:Aste57867_10271 protein n=1 Tax=Aphanomyces stellatus TaxID=120398 RepID=A0A485KQ03_9STRA|nr:hypothetical protein As57867_010231 [Aphanomyces stellatus]VFT87146.1 Aste57867_10271 [Aphanomyces stellatus]